MTTGITQLTEINEISRSTERKSKSTETFVPKIFKVALLFCLFFLGVSATQKLSAQPATPVGFGASTPSNSSPGEIFVSCGPIVGSNDIVYKLFYSITASAPTDPLTATEHIFGSTTDGGGTNPFGFRITGLTPDTEYTFWLYQYDTSTSTYSMPAMSTATSSPEGPPPTPVGFGASTPSDGSSGEIFVSCGPIVGSNDIVYKLFYSITASAPTDPLTATEHIFGSTTDGGGTNPFGFRITSLAPGTDYTFWLYQYNTGTMEYSLAPASEAAVSSGVALPVIWGNPLKAIVIDNDFIKVNWSIAQQINNDKFIIEFSHNGIDFSPIGDILGEGTTNVMQEYSYTHRKPVLGYNYYRIQQLDYDGSYDKSNIASVWYEGDKEVIMYPNPASSVVTVNLTTQTRLNVKDFYGRVVKSLSLAEGENVVSIGDLSNGMYIFEFENGQVEIFMKQ